MEVKRFVKYIIAVLVLFLTFISVAKAAESTPKTITLEYNSEYTLLEATSEKREISCDVTGGVIEESPFTLNEYTPSESTEIGKKFIISFGKVVNGSGNIKIGCTYKDPDDEIHNLNYIFKYSMKSEFTSYVSIKLDYNSSPSYDLYTNLEMTEFVSLKLDDPDEILSADCSSHKCSISIRPGYTELADAVINGTLVYKTQKNNIEVTFTSTLKVSVSGAQNRLNVGGPGKCETPSSDWTFKGVNIYATRKLNKVPVPNCTPKTNYPLLEFKGWVEIKGDAADSWSSSQTINTCASYNPTKNNVTISSTGNTYFPCYARSNGIIINGNGNKIVFGDDEENWVKYGAISSYFNNHGNNIKLPEVEITGYNSQNKEGLGWYNQTTGQYYQPGALVPADGSTYVYQTKTVTVYRNYYKSIYVNQPYVLKPSDAKITKCVSKDTNKITTSGVGECILLVKILLDITNTLKLKY